jgi:hypothetical protein
MLCLFPPLWIAPGAAFAVDEDGLDCALSEIMNRFLGPRVGEIFRARGFRGAVFNFFSFAGIAKIKGLRRIDGI